MAEEDAEVEVWDAKSDEGRYDIVVGSVMRLEKQGRRSNCFYIAFCFWSVLVGCLVRDALVGRISCKVR